MKISVKWGIVLQFGLIGGALTAPSSQNYSDRYAYTQKANYPRDDYDPSINQLRNALSLLKNNVSNHETEIRTFEHKLDNQTNVLEQIQQQMTQDLQEQKDFSKSSVINLENKLDSKLDGFNQILKALDTLSKSTIADVRQLSNQANETIKSLDQLQKNLEELSQKVESQQQYIQKMEEVIQSLVDLVQTKEEIKAGVANSPSLHSSTKSYSVKSGDYLEKIARLHHVSVQALRDANPTVENDRIFQGQILVIP